MGEPNQQGIVYVNYNCITCGMNFGINVSGATTQAYNAPDTSVLFCSNCTQALKKLINREKTIPNI